jgi:hypothetical protein
MESTAFQELIAQVVAQRLNSPKPSKRSRRSRLNLRAQLDSAPGFKRQPLKKLDADAEALLKLLHRWRKEADAAGCQIKRIAVAYEAGRLVRPETVAGFLATTVDFARQRLLPSRLPPKARQVKNYFTGGVKTGFAQDCNTKPPRA